MLAIEKYFCVNEDCALYGLRGKGNIVKCGVYGKHRTQLLQCNVCKQRFSENRNTVFFDSKYSAETIRRIILCVAEGNGIRSTARILNLSKDSVNRIIIKAGEHCQATLSNLLQSLHLEQCQLDELWSFVQKKELSHQQTKSSDTDEHGSG